MKTVRGLAERAVEAFNRAAWWRGECGVWRQRMFSASFDRWLYLRLHQCGWMGRGERAALQRMVRPGMTVVDVGSNLGLYTVLLSRLVGEQGRVIAFEPDPELVPVLTKSCVASGCGNVSIRAQALGRRSERMTLHTLAVNTGDNHLGDGGGRWLRRSVEVEVLALDEALPDLVPDLVKIDVQGWELEVLRGMAATLERCPRSIVYFEFWPAGFLRAGYSAEDLIAFFAERGWQLYHAHTAERLDGAALAKLTARLTGWAHADLVASRQPWMERAD